MNRRLFGTLGIAAALVVAAGCKTDPLSDLDGNAAAVVTDFDLVKVSVGDTVTVTASVLDGRATPLATPITFTTCSGVATTAVDTSYHPVPATSARVWIIGASLGTTCVIAQGGGLADTVDVETFPDALVITGGPANDSIPSGVVTQFTWEYRDHQGNVLTGLPAPTFTSSDAARASVVTPPPVGAVQGKAPGQVTLTAVGVGLDPDGLEATRVVTVVAGSFTGGVTPTAVDPGDTVTLTAAVGGPGFDADTRVDVRGVRAFTFGVTATTMKFVVPGLGVVGGVPMAISNMGPDQAAQNGTLTSNTASYADPYDGVNDDPSTAPIITANGDYFIIVAAPCANGVGAGDCDDFFRVRNNSAAAVTITVNTAWFTPADIDAYGLDPTLDFCTYDGGCVAASAANPEVFSMSVPAGATWVIYLNLWVTGGATSTLARVRVSGLP